VPIEVPMGAISPTMESGQVVEWRVKVGDQVKEGDTLADVQTDKAVMPLESFDEGIVAVLCAEVGQDIAVGKPVLILAAKGEDPKAIAASSGSSAKPARATAAVAAKAEPEPEIKHEAQGASAPYREMTSSPTRPEVSNGQEKHAATATEVHGGGRIKSSPLARKIAASAKIELGDVPPTGPGGRVIRRDVEAFLASRPAGGAALAPAATRAAPSARPSSAAAKRTPHTPMRKTIAARMVQAKQSAPEIHVSVDIRVDEIVVIRERLNKQLAAEKIKLSMGDFVTKAVALALRKHPGVNATFEPEAIVEHPEVNVGIAVALEGGLMVPVLHNADALGLKEIRTGSEALAEAARAGKLTSSQLTGGTFTISNLGMYGVREFDAILNLPQVGILAVGAAEKRPVVVGDTLKVGTVMTVNLTVDHRAVDGAMAAEFLRTLKGLLEEPTSMLL
jgi:pyruvate dehydrogenase E2 component (dihydrolipoamide acetyltransferase)